MPSTEFDDLIRRLREADELAAAEIVESYETEIRRYIRFRLKTNRMRRLLESVDVCQSVFAKFFVDLQREAVCPQSPSQLRALLMTMAKNKLIDKARFNRAEKRDIGKLEPEGERAMERTPDRQPEPGTVLADRELLERFRSNLSDQDREIVEARMQGSDWADIAAKFGSTADAVRKRATRAIEAAAKKMEVVS